MYRVDSSTDGGISMNDIEDYEGREHNRVKHMILQSYLQKLAYKNAWRGSITYVDGFAGPWKSATETLADTSPHIALNMLLKVRSDLAGSSHKALRVRCLFIERESAAYQRLMESVTGVGDAEVKVLNGTFESVIPDVVQFARKVFTFFFIDPTGWTGYGLHAITPILCHQPGEVLINFMTGDIIRFIDDEKSPALPTFVDLFGEPSYRDKWKGLTGLDREDAIVAAYCTRLREVGSYPHVVSAPILHRTENRIRYHLIYATRHIEGLRVFREAENSAMKTAQDERAKARGAKHVKQTGQPHLPLDSDATLRLDPFYQKLRSRYVAFAEGEVLSHLRASRRALFDDLVALALSHPMVFEGDLKHWLEAWVKTGIAGIECLGPRERVPKVGKGHQIVWIGRQ
jgi:three-Cys-motif partner protein